MSYITTVTPGGQTLGEPTSAHNFLKLSHPSLRLRLSDAAGTSIGLGCSRCGEALRDPLRALIVMLPPPDPRDPLGLLTPEELAALPLDEKTAAYLDDPVEDDQRTLRGIPVLLCSACYRNETPCFTLGALLDIDAQTHEDERGMASALGQLFRRLERERRTCTLTFAFVDGALTKIGGAEGRF